MLLVKRATEDTHIQKYVNRGCSKFNLALILARRLAVHTDEFHQYMNSNGETTLPYERLLFITFNNAESDTISSQFSAHLVRDILWKKRRSSEQPLLHKSHGNTHFITWIMRSMSYVANKAYKCVIASVLVQLQFCNFSVAIQVHCLKVLSSCSFSSPNRYNMLNIAWRMHNFIKWNFNYHLNQNDIFIESQS